MPVCCCRCLNTWGRHGPSSRTFHLSAASTHGSLIDYAITRQCSADGISRQTRPLPASGLVTTKGMYHLPLRGSIARPHVPHTKPRPNKVPSVSQVHTAFASDPARLILFRHQVEQQLRHTEHPDELNGVMLQAWRAAAPVAAAAAYPTKPTYSTQIQEMWHIRRSLRFSQQGHSTLAGMFRSWVQVKRLQLIQRSIAKEARVRKKQALTNFLNEIDTPEYSNRMSRLFKAIKRFAPKTTKQRIQLKDALGHLLTPSDAAQAYSTFFHELYQSPAVPPAAGILTEDLGLSWAEWFSALVQTQARKAVPSHYAPALLWKHCADLLAHFIAPRARFPAGPIEWPETWTDAFLALLPKPPKPPSHPKALRPISLLDPLSKSLGVILAQRLGPYTRHYLDTLPQHAYLAQRSTASAISKVMSHCHQIRQLLQSQKLNIHGSRDGQRKSDLVGGLILSVDLSRAFDSLPFWLLRQSLDQAGVPVSLRDLILSFHAHVRFKVANSNVSVLAGRGIRQGCPLAPQLWAIVSGCIIHMIAGRSSSDFCRMSSVNVDLKLALRNQSSSSNSGDERPRKPSAMSLVSWLTVNTRECGPVVGYFR